LYILWIFHLWGKSILSVAITAQSEFGDLSTEEVCENLTDLELCDEDSDCDELGDVLWSSYDCAFIENLKVWKDLHSLESILC
jgi:hypothetical protein